MIQFGRKQVVVQSHTAPQERKIIVVTRSKHDHVHL